MNNISLTQRQMDYNIQLTKDDEINNNMRRNSNKDKNANLKKGPGIILDGNRSILSKISENERNFLEDDSKKKNVNVENNNINGTSGSKQMTVGNFNQQQKLLKTKSNGILGSFKNLFSGDKSKN